MKIDFDKFKSTVRGVILSSPMEFFFAFIFFGLGLIVIFGKGTEEYRDILMKILFFFFVCMAASYSLNNLFRSSKRIVYYLSPILLLPIYLYVQSSLYNEFTVVVSSLCALFFIYVSRQTKDNKEFVANAQSVTVNLIFTGILTSLVLAIASSIILSINLIFDIKFDLPKIYSLIVVTCISLFAPFLFLFFEQKEKFALSITRLVTIIVNYILTPAIFIYGIILYIYFAKIIALWSLPKGVISVTAIIFLSGGILVKGCRMLQSNRFLNCFLVYFEYLSLPALVMLWISVIYRISQYGFTTNRIYLLLVVLTFTMWTAAFIIKKTSSYKFLLTATIIPFLLFSYMPEIRGENGLGINGEDEEGNINLIVKSNNIYIEGYKNLYYINSFITKDEKYYIAKDDKLSIFDENGELMFEKNYDDFFSDILEQMGIDREVPITRKLLESLDKREVIYRKDNLMIVLNNIYFTKVSGEFKIDYLSIRHIVTK